MSSATNTMYKAENLIGDDFEGVRLLHSGIGDSCQDSNLPKTIPKQSRKQFYDVWKIHLVFILMYSLLFVYLLRAKSCQLWTVPSPATAAIEYERRTFYPVTYGNPYTGEPRPEFDEAWHDLLRFAPCSVGLDSHIRVSREELALSNYTSLAFKGGTGYIAQLASTHQLHCLKQIRHYLHRDHYFPNATEQETKAQGMHVDHCLEVLRLATMCSGDTSLTPFYFASTDDGLLYPFVKTRTYHHCVNWDRLREWTKERSVDLFDPDLLDIPPGSRLLQRPVPSMVL